MFDQTDSYHTDYRGGHVERKIPLTLAKQAHFKSAVDIKKEKKSSPNGFWRIGTDGKEVIKPIEAIDDAWIEEMKRWHGSA